MIRTKKNGKLKSAKDILIMGVGNILLQDEGVGIHAVKELEKLKWPEKIKLLDGGTGGFHLLEVLQDYETLIIIDASLDNDLPGSIKMLKPMFSKDFPKALSSHDIGLKDLMDSASLIGPLPEIHLIVVTIAPQQELSMELSEGIAKIMPQLISKVKKTVDIISKDQTL